MVYTNTWNFLGIVNLPLSPLESITTPAYNRRPIHVEFYDSRCDKYVRDIVCTAGTATSAPTTAAPTTAAPTTAAPTTATPTTAAPTTATPTTAAPTTAAPTTAAPTTAAPTTVAPTTTAPTTPTPTTAAPTATTDPGSTAYNHRGIYLWGDNGCLVGIWPQGQTYQSACRQPTVAAYQNIFFYTLLNPLQRYAPFTHLYLELTAAKLQTSPGSIRAFLAQARERGIYVELLGGHENWMRTAANTATPIQLCQAVRAFNDAASNDAERFVGVHLDLEPHILPNWTGNRAAGRDPYNDVYEANLLTILRSCKAALAGTTATVTWDAAVFYPVRAVDVWEPLVAERLVDRIVFMNYYDDETTFLYGDAYGHGGVVPLLDAMKGTGIPAIFAVETQAPPLLEPDITFGDDGSLPMENLLARVNSMFAQTPEYHGVAVHHYWSYRLLQPDRPPLSPRCITSGRSVTVYPDEVPTASIGVYRQAGYTFTTFRNVAGSGPYTITGIPVNGPYLVELYDAPNLNNANLDSIVYYTNCVNG